MSPVWPLSHRNTPVLQSLSPVELYSALFVAPTPPQHTVTGLFWQIQTPARLYSHPLLQLEHNKGGWWRPHRSSAAHASWHWATRAEPAPALSTIPPSRPTPVGWAEQAGDTSRCHRPSPSTPGDARSLGSAQRVQSGPAGDGLKTEHPTGLCRSRDGGTATNSAHTERTVPSYKTQSVSWEQAGHWPPCWGALPQRGCVRTLRVLSSAGTECSGGTQVPDQLLKILLIVFGHVTTNSSAFLKTVRRSQAPGCGRRWLCHPARNPPGAQPAAGSAHPRGLCSLPRGTGRAQGTYWEGEQNRYLACS